MRYVALRSAARTTLPTSSLRRLPDQRKLSPCLALLRRLHTSYTSTKEKLDLPTKLSPTSTTDYLRALSQCLERMITAEGNDGSSIGRLRPHVLTAVNTMRVDIDQQHVALRAFETPTALTWRSTFEAFHQDVLDHLEDIDSSHAAQLKLLCSHLDGVGRALALLDKAMDAAAEEERKFAAIMRGFSSSTPVKKPVDVPLVGEVASPDIQGQRSPEVDPLAAVSATRQDPEIETKSSAVPQTAPSDAKASSEDAAFDNSHHSLDVVAEAETNVGGQTGPSILMPLMSATTLDFRLLTGLLDKGPGAPVTDADYDRLYNIVKALLQKSYEKDPPGTLPTSASSNTAEGQGDPVVRVLPLSSDAAGMAVEAGIESADQELGSASSLPTESKPSGTTTFDSPTTVVHRAFPMFSRLKRWVNDLVRDSSPEHSKTTVRTRPQNYQHFHADEEIQKMSFNLEFMLSDLWTSRSHLLGNTVPPEVMKILQVSGDFNLGYCRREDCGISPKYAQLSLAENLHGYAKHLQDLMAMIYQAVPDVSDPEVAKSMRGCLYRIQQSDRDLDWRMEEIRAEFFVREPIKPSVNSLDHERSPKDVTSYANVDGTFRPPLTFDGPLFNLGHVSAWISGMVKASALGGDQEIFRDRPHTVETYHADELMEELEHRLLGVLSDVWLTRSLLFGHRAPSAVASVLQSDWANTMGWCRRSGCGITPKYARLSFIESLHDYFGRLENLVRLVNEAVSDIDDPHVRDKMNRGCFSRVGNTCANLHALMEEIEEEIVQEGRAEGCL